MASRYLNNITVNDAYTLPSADGTNGQIITTDGSGSLSFSDAAASDAIVITVKNVSGGSLSKGTVIHPSPTASPPSGNVIEVIAANNSAASTMPAIGVLNETLADDAEGDAIAFGAVKGIDTSSFSAGDAIFVNSSGSFTTTKPTGTALIQKIGIVVKVHASNGSIKVFGANRVNDVPNLSTGKIWVGTATNTAESSVIDIDETNNILTVDGKVYFKNVFSTLSDLPSATTYHGMFAHVHSEGAAYYAHSGSWVKLANHSDLAGSANDATITLTAGTGLSGGGNFTTDQSSNETITVDLDDTAVTAGTYGDANNTPQITVDAQGRITSASTVTTAGSGGGGGSAGELSIERDVFTATANQTAFTITSDISANSNTQVYIDGVYQSKDNYTSGGSVITLSTGVPAGAEVEVVHLISVLSKVNTDTFTGDGSETDFTASKDVTNENVTQIYIDGVYQSKDNYTTSGTTITFSTAPPDGSEIEVVHFTAATYSSLNSNQFTGTGSQTDFTLTQEVEEDKCFVFIQGVYQEKSTYSISGTTLTFTTAPQNTYSIEVITVGSISVFSDSFALFLDTFTGNGSTTDYSLSTTPASENAIDVYLNGLYQNKDTFSLSGSTLTFSTAPTNGTAIEVKSTGGVNSIAATPAGSYGVVVASTNTTAVKDTLYVLTASITLTLPASPSDGDSVKISNRSGVATSTIARNGEKIMGATSDLTVDKLNSGFEMIYSGSAEGWILIGVEGTAA